MRALKKGHKETAQLLLVHGAHVDMQDKEGSTALMRACDDGHNAKVYVQLLLNFKANVNIHKNFGETALMRCLERKDAAELLLKEWCSS